MVSTGLVSLTICANDALDVNSATNLTITVCGGICTLYGAFVAANSGEHLFKSKYGTATGDGPVSPAPPGQDSPFEPPPDLQEPEPG